VTIELRNGANTLHQLKEQKIRYHVPNIASGTTASIAVAKGSSAGIPRTISILIGSAPANPWLVADTSAGILRNAPHIGAGDRIARRRRQPRQPRLSVGARQIEILDAYHYHYTGTTQSAIPSATPSIATDTITNRCMTNVSGAIRCAPILITKNEAPQTAPSSSRTPRYEFA